MSKDGIVQLPQNGQGAKIDCTSLSVAGAVVMRQRVVIGDSVASANFATVTGGALQVYVTGTQNVTGQVSIGPGTSNIGTINNISAAVSVTLPANIGIVNNISAPVVLAAGTSNIGTINNISAPVVLAAGTNNIGTINNISAAVTLAAGSNNIGTINAISATVKTSRANTGTSISDLAAIALGTASSVLVLAAGTRFEARFYNAGSNVIALQAGTATIANSAIVLQPGDMWIEDTVPQTNWYGIAQTGASTATVQVVT
jgi:hypothetical protein